jgi:hypothetical protein
MTGYELEAPGLPGTDPRRESSGTSLTTRCTRYRDRRLLDELWYFVRTADERWRRMGPSELIERVRTQANGRSASARLSHSPIWFQLAKFRLTIRLACELPVGKLQARASRPRHHRMPERTHVSW